MQAKSGFFRKIDWPVALFLVFSIFIALIMTPIYFWHFGLEWKIILFAVFYAGLTNLSITAGYHRLFSHRSYEANNLMKFLFLMIGSSAYQGSAYKWSVDHRRHHSKVDQDDDPYSINKGFWYAHMGWLFFKEDHPEIPTSNQDLKKDFWVKFQHKNYVPLSIFFGFLCPSLIGWALGSFWGGLLIAGLLRIVLTQQSTFFVNSLSHTLGTRPYADDISARDSIIVAILTHGEGYHNFHHKFQSDYRNGIKWYHWDPTKWTIQLLAVLGQAKKLKTISHTEILRAKLQIEEMKLKSKGFSDEKILHLKERMLAAENQIKKLNEDYKKLKEEYKRFKTEFSSEEKLKQIKHEIKLAQIEFKKNLEQWKIYLRHPEPLRV